MLQREQAVEVQRVLIVDNLHHLILMLNLHGTIGIIFISFHSNKRAEKNQEEIPKFHIDQGQSIQKDLELQKITKKVFSQVDFQIMVFLTFSMALV
jgi:hypothetical protein